MSIASDLQSAVKTIPLTQGKVALVDADDFETLSAFKWHYDHGYAIRSEGTKYVRTRIYMHRQIMKTPKGFLTDHINRDSLDNRKSNLRICNATESVRNRKCKKVKSSRYHGVSWDKAKQKWFAQITVNYNHYFLGYFSCEVSAAKCYDRGARKFHGSFASTNFPETA